MSKSTHVLPCTLITITIQKILFQMTFYQNENKNSHVIVLRLNFM